MKFKKHMLYDILIRPTPNGGFIVEVGCAKMVYSNHGSLLQDLSLYLKDPEAMEKQYNQDISKLDRVHIGPIVPSIYGNVIRKQKSEQQYQEVNHENSSG